MYYISEIEDWVIKDIGKSISENSTKKVKLRYSSLFIKNSIIHFGSLNTFLNQPYLPKKSNKIVVTWYHIPKNFTYTKSIKIKAERVDTWVTSNTLSESKLLKLGIPKNKIKLIPIAVDNLFLKSEKKIYEDEKKPFIIGSFLKDGSGWGEGNEPKFVKGPDILVKTLIELNKKLNIKVNLSGPSRGFVKNRLIENRIKYKHLFFEEKKDLVEFYKSCDICLITSREEGGPLSLLESLALGIPVISTKVGMSVDIIKDGYNGYLVDFENTKGIVKQILKLANNKGKLIELGNNARETKIHSYSDVSFEYDKIYNYD